MLRISAFCVVRSTEQSDETEQADQVDRVDQMDQTDQTASEGGVRAEPTEWKCIRHAMSRDAIPSIFDIEQWIANAQREFPSLVRTPGLPARDERELARITFDQNFTPISR